jgi:hypothetical protein
MISKRHGWDIQQYIVVFELDGMKHVGGHRGVEPKEIEIGRFESQHPKIKVVYFEPVENIQQYQDFVNSLARDPNWEKLTPQQFAASAEAAMKEATENSGVPLDHPAYTNEPGTTKLPEIVIPQAAKDAQPAVFNPQGT